MAFLICYKMHYFKNSLGNSSILNNSKAITQPQLLNFSPRSSFAPVSLISFNFVSPQFQLELFPRKNSTKHDRSSFQSNQILETFQLTWKDKNAVATQTESSFIVISCLIFSPNNLMPIPCSSYLITNNQQIYSLVCYWA